MGVFEKGRGRVPSGLQLGTGTRSVRCDSLVRPTAISTLNRGSKLHSSGVSHCGSPAHLLESIFLSFLVHFLC